MRVAHEISFTFYSHPMKDIALRWKATLTFAEGSTGSSFAVLKIVDHEGALIPSGTFDFAGCRIAVYDGIGKLRCSDFIRGKHEGAIWFTRKGGVPVPGALTFE